MNRRQPGAHPQPLPFAGPSAAIQALATEVTKLSSSDAPLLIVGETGTGKGVLARWIHASSSRANGPLVDVNCASLSRDLFESELYGFERGAFTGAVTAKTGLIEEAHGGVMFLDEVGDLDPAVQPRLLKVLEDKVSRRLGSVREHRSDVRFLFASNYDLGALVREKRFRQDLFYRINSLTLTCPPLRTRAEDIPEITGHLLDSISGGAGGPPLRIAADAMPALQAHDWPGNIRELRHVLERAALVCTGGVISAADLRLERVVRPPVERHDATLTLQGAENRHIRSVLAAEGGNVERTARRLGVPRSTLYQKIKTYKLGTADGDAIDKGDPADEPGG